VIEHRPPWWLRRPVIIAAIIISLIPASLIAARLYGYKPFHVPSEAMEPTLRKGDRFIALMHGPGDLRRGDIIVFAMPGSMYVKRVAGLPGDRIGLRGGIVFLNGKKVEQKFLERDEIELEAGPAQVRKLAEQFPGEAAAHQIYDSRQDDRVDEMEEQIVQPGHVFVLGDHRDLSADSRVPRSSMGVEQLPIQDIKGMALFHSLGSSKGLGEPIAP
jgi:signal peptidase I